MHFAQQQNLSVLLKQLEKLFLLFFDVSADRGTFVRCVVGSTSSPSISEGLDAQSAGPEDKVQHWAVIKPGVKVENVRLASPQPLCSQVNGTHFLLHLLNSFPAKMVGLFFCRSLTFSLPNNEGCWRSSFWKESHRQVIPTRDVHFLQLGFSLASPQHAWTVNRTMFSRTSSDSPQLLLSLLLGADTASDDIALSQIPVKAT